MFIIITGEIDLSAGSLLGLLGGVMAIMDLTYHFPIAITITTVIVLGILIGLLNGYRVAYLRIPAFITVTPPLPRPPAASCWGSPGMTVSPESPDLDPDRQVLPPNHGR